MIIQGPQKINHLITLCLESEVSKTLRLTGLITTLMHKLINREASLSAYLFDKYSCTPSAYKNLKMKKYHCPMENK